MKDECVRMKNEGGFEDEQTDICDCRVAFPTEKLHLGKKSKLLLNQSDSLYISKY